MESRSLDKFANSLPKIVFLSQESSAEVVAEVLNTGACGYVVKARAASQLLRALDAAMLRR
jgi:DNA-binding NarL/FixJ family response regulator